MGLTLDELKSLHSVLSWARQTESCCDAMMEEDIEEGLSFLNREIKLKETDFITMTDVNGNMMDDGN